MKKMKIVRNLNSYFILKAISDEPLHGYGIKKKVQYITEGEIDIPPGTLYQCIFNLRDNSYLTQQEATIIGGKTLKIYSIRSKGREFLFKIDSMFKKVLEIKD